MGMVDCALMARVRCSGMSDGVSAMELISSRCHFQRSQLETGFGMSSQVWNQDFESTGVGEVGIMGACGAWRRTRVVWRRHALAAEGRPREGEVETMWSKRRCECHDQYDVLVPYVDAWRWQKSCVGEKVAMLGRGEDFDDTLIVLQHPPVYTLGTRSSEANLKFDVNDPPFELHRTERGGEVTYHGPGQIVMYPILNLQHHSMDLHWYLRTLEEVVICALDMACRIQPHRIDGLTGVWVDNRKVAAIGV